MACVSIATRGTHADAASSTSKPSPRFRRLPLRRRRPRHRSIRPQSLLLAILLGAGAPGVVLAQTTDSQGRTIDSTNPAAKRINQANPRVIHAGPGTPAAGTIHVPPAQAKKDKKDEDKKD